MKIVIALGGNALLRRAQAPSAANLLSNIRLAATQLARIALAPGRHQIVVTHGNGPPGGLNAPPFSPTGGQHPQAQAYPLDMLDAGVAGMLGCLLEQEIANLLPPTRTVVNVLTRVQVARLDPAFDAPSKAIGPIYTPEEAALAIEAAMEAHSKPWTMGPDGGGLRRLVASPKPLAVLALSSLRCLLDSGALVIAGGGGGVPVVRRADGPGMEGVEALIDKDLCSALIATELHADCLIFATDVPALCVNWGRPSQRAIGRTTPERLAAHEFAIGSMAPKVEAACAFVKATGNRVGIGLLNEIEALLAGSRGTQVCPATALSGKVQEPAAASA